MNQKRIVIDGKIYTSVSEMPADVRSKYEQAIRTLKDEDRDGTPDAFDSRYTFTTDPTNMKVVVNGQEYTRLEDLPPDVRAIYEQAMDGLDRDRNGIPDFIEGNGSRSFASFGTAADTNPPPASYAPQTAPAAIMPDTTNGWMLIMAAVVVLLLCAVGAAGVMYFFLR